jgi:hypothetical protein
LPLAGLLIAGVDIWGLELPWWVWVSGSILAGLALLFLGFMAWDWWETRSLRHGADYPEEGGTSEITVPYYVETDSLKALASELKLDIPIARQVTRSRRLSFGFKGASGEGGQSETSEFSASISLPRLAKTLQEPVRYDGNDPAKDVTDAPLVSDEGLLSGAIEQIQSDFPATSETSELLSRVQEVFGNERVEAMAGKKRKEFEEIGKHNQLMIIHGQFGLAERGGEGIGPKLRLTHFNPTPAYVAANARASGDQQVEIDLVPIPDGVGLQVTLPDANGLTPAGRERLHRGQSVYVGIIAHSPSFDEHSGLLTCSAWAVWGEQMPDWEERTSQYRHYGRNGPRY